MFGVGVEWADPGARQAKAEGSFEEPQESSVAQGHSDGVGGWYQLA